MANKNKFDCIKIAFYASMVIALLYLVIFGIVTNEAPYKFLIYSYGNTMIGDFWMCVQDNLTMQPYINNSSYPALACLIFGFFAKQIPVESNGGFNFSAPANNILFFAYMLVTISVFINLLNSYKAGNQFEKAFFGIIILLSAPYIYMFERGNLIFVALLFSMAYVFGKDSKNKYVRELSYICLGIAAALKIYPAVLGLLLIKDKNYKAAVRTTLYGIAFFVIPFFAYGGISDMYRMYTNIRFAENQFAGTGVGGKVNLSSTLSVIIGLCGIDYMAPIIQKLFAVLPYIYMIVAVIACMFHKSKWKVYTLLVSMIILVPSFSFVYTLIFFIIPLISFLDTKEDRTWIDWACLICFVAIMVPIVHNPTELLKNFQTGFDYLFSTFIQGIAVLSISAILVLEGLIYGTLDMKEKINSRK